MESMQTAIHCEWGISAQLRSADSEIRMKSKNSGMISFRELVEQQCDKEWMNGENVHRRVALRQSGENRKCVMSWKRMCGYVRLYVEKEAWIVLHSILGAEWKGVCEEKEEDEGERDGLNCRGLWCMKQCRIWKRLGIAFGKKRRNLDGKVDLECVGC